jgi:hypothetical protein
MQISAPRFLMANCNGCVRIGVQAVPLSGSEHTTKIPGILAAIIRRPTTQNPAGRPWSVAANHRRQDQSPNPYGTMEIGNPEDSHDQEDGNEDSRESWEDCTIRPPAYNYTKVAESSQMGLF